MGRSSAHNRMVGIHRIVLALGSLYVLNDEASGECYKIALTHNANNRACLTSLLGRLYYLLGGKFKIQKYRMQNSILTDFSVALLRHYEEDFSPTW